MKNVVVILLTVIFVTISSCSDDNTTITELETSALSQQEVDDLKFLREEEKLARDVYLFSFDKYGEAIFNSISQSEQQHMDQVLLLLNTYQLSDPASTERGVFTNQALQGLYADLTAQSSISLVEALKVGATIEDLDINDIDDFESKTNQADILNVYDKLKCGSRNHIRNYVSQLVLNSFDYAPQFISLDEFTEIIASSNEQCGR